METRNSLIVDKSFNVAEDRQWAAGLSQKEFDKELLNRNAKCDVFPLVANYINVGKSVNRGMDPINPEEMVLEIAEPNKKQREEAEKLKGKEVVMPQQKMFNCKFCDREIKSKVAITNHEKACKFGLNERL